MKITSRYATAIHTLLFVEYFQNTYKVTSTFIANSTNTNPVIIRQILGKLQKANLVVVKRGIGGAYVERDLNDISLLDIFKAVAECEKDIFNLPNKANELCPIGQTVSLVIENSLDKINQSMLNQMSSITLKSIYDETIEKLKTCETKQ